MAFADFLKIFSAQRQVGQAESLPIAVSELKRRSRKIRLFSPIPPLKTGTADYIDSLISELKYSDIDTGNIEIIVDDEMFYNSQIPEEYRGLKVSSYRSIACLVPEGETNIYFCANNEFHYYVHRCLYLSQKCGGRVVSVIHEPSNFMLFNTLCATNRYPFSDDQFPILSEHQLGEQAKFWLDARRSGQLPFEIEFGIMCQSHTLALSDEVWTHSKYAALKLILESPHHRGEMPRVVVSQHPHNVTKPAADPSARPSPKAAGAQGKDGDVFTIGIFGWVSPSKRVVQAFRAIACARAMLGRHLKDKIRVIIIGQLPDPSHYDPQKAAAEHGISDIVTFYGFTPRDEFVDKVASCNLILNLRYPSCGESSGTLQFASDLQIPVISTSFQAFRESDADILIAPFEPLEIAQLSSHLWTLVSNWASDDVAEKQSVPTDAFSNRFRISDLIESEMHRR